MTCLAVIRLMVVIAPVAVHAGERSRAEETRLAVGDTPPADVLVRRANEALNLLASEVDPETEESFPVVYRIRPAVAGLSYQW